MNMIIMKKILVILLNLSFLALVNTADALNIVDEDVFLHCDDNEVYNISDSTQNFDHIVIADDYIQFNTTAFKCDFDTGVNITINFLNVLVPSGNLTILSFNYTQGDGSSYHEFNISGFQTSQAYWIYTNSSFLIEVISDASVGWVNFTSDIYYGQVDIIQYAFITFSNENPTNESWLFFNTSGFLTSIDVNYSNFDGTVYVNGTFSWFNGSSGDWKQYDMFNITANQTVTSVVNVNFSSINISGWQWKVHAIANDTSVTQQEDYLSKRFYSDTNAEHNPVPLILAIGSMFSICIGLPFFMAKRKKKKMRG